MRLRARPAATTAATPPRRRQGQPGPPALLLLEPQHAEQRRGQLRGDGSGPGPAARRRPQGTVRLDQVTQQRQVERWMDVEIGWRGSRLLLGRGAGTGVCLRDGRRLACDLGDQRLRRVRVHPQDATRTGRPRGLTRSFAAESCLHVYMPPRPAPASTCLKFCRSPTHPPPVSHAVAVPRGGNYDAYVTFECVVWVGGGVGLVSRGCAAAWRSASSGRGRPRSRRRSARRHQQHLARPGMIRPPHQVQELDRLGRVAVLGHRVHIRATPPASSNPDSSTTFRVATRTADVALVNALSATTTAAPPVVRPPSSSRHRRHRRPIARTRPRRP